MTIDKDWILDVIKLAGDEIMKIYQASEGISIDRKADNSPLTEADRAAHNVIVRELKNKYPHIPIISEENEIGIPYETRQDFEYYWLVDPLDGTKEFINRNGEFTVNIALIFERYPIAGFIYVPAMDTFYYALDDKAFKKKGNEEIEIKVNHKDKDFIAVRSKSHAAPEEEELLSEYNSTESISVGSSLKFCMVAEGKADIYYRHGPTMEWDTGAGQAVVEGAGGKVFTGTGDDKQRFVYNKRDLRNSSFLCVGF